MSETFDLVRFLVERAHEEARLHYVRNAVFMGFHTVALGFVLKEPQCWQPYAFCGVICLVWVAVNVKSVAYNRFWLDGARSNVAHNPDLAEAFGEALKTPGLNEPHAVILSERFWRFWNWTVADLFIILPFLFLLAWGGLLIQAIGRA